MRKLTKTCILATTLFTMVFSPLAQVSAAAFQGTPQNYSHFQGSSFGDVEQVRHKGRHHYHDRHHYNRHHHYKKHRRHHSNRHCRYSHHHGGMVCSPHYRHHW